MTTSDILGGVHENEPEKGPPPNKGEGTDAVKWARFQELLSRRRADRHSVTEDEAEELDALSWECADYGIPEELRLLTENLKDALSTDKKVKRLNYLLGCELEGQHLASDESAELRSLAEEVGAQWLLQCLAVKASQGFGADYVPLETVRRPRIPKDLHDTLAWGTEQQRERERQWRELMYEHGSVEYDGLKVLKRWMTSRLTIAQEFADLLKSNVEPDDMSAFLEWYGHELLRVASELPGEQGVRFRRAAGVVSRDKRESAHRPAQQRSQNQNWLARPDQEHFTYADIAYLAGCSVRQAKRVLTELYGLERKGARRWFTREQVTAAFPHVRLES